MGAGTSEVGTAPAKRGTDLYDRVSDHEPGHRGLQPRLSNVADAAESRGPLPIRFLQVDQRLESQSCLF